MINKKLLVAIAITTSILSASANAKTQGHYVGLNLINTSTVETNALGSGQKHRNDNFSVGADYKYAFNFDKFFVAPGIFYDYNNNNADYASWTGEMYSGDLAYSYGAKVDFGYDVTDKFSPFVTIGYSETRSSGTYYDTSEYYREDFTDEGLVLGLGLRYAINDMLSINASYEATQLGGASNLDAIIGGTDKINPAYKVIKLGVAYNF